MIKSELMKWYDSLDSERGCVVDIKAFDEESDAVEYAKETLNRRYLATKGNSKEQGKRSGLDMFLKFKCPNKRTFKGEQPIF